jgi:carboxyl-terminal processing protease
MQVWLDARGVGLNRAAWRAACLADLDAHPPHSLPQAHLQIKQYLGRGPADAYTRFIPPEEFKALTKYDVTGVGLNLGSAEEFVAKAARPLPRGRSVADGGVWVVGLIKACACLPECFCTCIVAWGYLWRSDNAQCIA